MQPDKTARNVETRGPGRKAGDLSRVVRYGRTTVTPGPVIPVVLWLAPAAILNPNHITHSSGRHGCLEISESCSPELPSWWRFSWRSDFPNKPLRRLR